MLEPESLNAKDVLSHLKTLGYDYVSPQQLKEFLHDLKKLIKYDQKHKLKTRNNDTVVRDSFESDCSYDEYYGSSEKSYEESDCKSLCSSSVTYTDSKSKFNDINKHSGRSTSEWTQTAHTSFIRPWNLHLCKEFSNKGKRNLDPVRLYHQYQKFWKNQNIPGESKHSELRWVVRNKMLGQEPHPRVCIQNPKYFS